MHTVAIAVVLSMLCAPCAFAGAVDANEYQKRLKVYQTIEPVGQSALGESINLYTGETSFTHTDLRFEGIGPPIEIVRRLSRRDGGQDGVPNGFGDWHLALPHIATLTPGNEGWQVGADAPSVARCTQFGPMYSPPEGAAPRYGGLDQRQWWRGYQLVMPNAGTQDLLRRTASNDRKPTTGTWPAVTNAHWQVGCLPATRNGQPGEAFVALSPDGLKFRLDHLSYAFYPPLSQNVSMEGKPAVYTLTRRMARMHVTRVEDRFGNWLDYTWEGHRPTRIAASDGRIVSFEWDVASARIVSITQQPGSAKQRTWRYAYRDNRLSSVTLPDGSAWSFDIGDLVAASPRSVSLSGCFASGFDPIGGAGSTPAGQFDATATLRHPSGLTGTFRLAWRLRAQSSVPSHCMGQTSMYESLNPYYRTLSIIDKILSGPGVPRQAWTYAYSPARASVDRMCTQGCATTAHVEVTDPA
ncbi:MAG: hypothetical protein HOQ01_09300, partial [Lysobacter sp.]|nr:hypothetical protein [Lysobacter sp.]